MKLSEVLELGKKHGFGLVLSLGIFVYFYNRVETLESKYDNCMNERINDAYRNPNQFQGRSAKNTVRDFAKVAILPEKIEIKKEA